MAQPVKALVELSNSIVIVDMMNAAAIFDEKEEGPSAPLLI